MLQQLKFKTRSAVITLKIAQSVSTNYKIKVMLISFWFQELVQLYSISINMEYPNQQYEECRPGILKLRGTPPLGGVKASLGGREHDSDILMKSSSELQSNLVTTSLLIHYIRICDLVLKNNFVWTLIRYCFNFRCLIYIDTSLYASPSFSAVDVT